MVRHIDQAAQPKSGPDEKAIKCKRDNDGNKGGRYNNRRHKPLAHNPSSYNGGLAGGSSVISLPLANLLASIGINPVPSFAIRSKVTNLSFGVSLFPKHETKRAL